MAKKKVTKKAGKKANVKRKVAKKKVEVYKKKPIKKTKSSGSYMANQEKFIGSYILDENGEPKKEKNVLKWAKWFEKSGKQRIVKQSKPNKYFVSTIFLGLDHSFGSGELVLWETMVWNPAGRDIFQERHSSREKAEMTHDRLVEQIVGGRELK